MSRMSKQHDSAFHDWNVCSLHYSRTDVVCDIDELEQEHLEESQSNSLLEKSQILNIVWFEVLLAPANLLDLQFKK